VVVALGRIAFDTYLSILATNADLPARSSFRFEHGRIHDLGHGRPKLISSYHPSQQNTSTGRLTREMFDEIFSSARELISVTR
jgi:uracil-DNA glycosylase